MMTQKIVTGRANENLDSIPETSLEDLDVSVIDDEQWARITSVLLERRLFANRIIQAVATSVYRDQRAEQRGVLEILNEIVRHDIHNALQVVVANADLLEEHVDEEAATYRDRILESTREAIEITNTARDITSTFRRIQTNLGTQPLRDNHNPPAARGVLSDEWR